MKLGGGEQIIYRIKKHWINYFVCIALFWTVIGTYYLIRLFFDEIILTNRQFYVRTGIIGRNVVSTPLRKINNVRFEQGIIGRILGFGTIYVESAATLGISGYDWIADPAKVKSIIDQAIDAKESQR